MRAYLVDMLALFGIAVLMGRRDPRGRRGRGALMARRAHLGSTAVGPIGGHLACLSIRAAAHHAIVQELFRNPGPADEIACFPLDHAQRKAVLREMQAEDPTATLRDAPNYVAREGDVLGYGDTRAEAIRQVREGLAAPPEEEIDR